MKRLLVIHTGGTISMSQDQTNKVITNEENPISQHQNIISQYAEVDEINLLNIPSPHMTISNVVRLRDEIIHILKKIYMMDLSLLMEQIHLRKQLF